MAEKSSKKTPRDFLRVVFRRKWLFLLSASLSAVVILQAEPHFSRKQYTGTTKVQRRTGVAGGKSVEQDIETLRRTLRHELAGLLPVQKVAKDLGLFDGLPRDAEGRFTTPGELRKQQIVAGLISSIKVVMEFTSKDVDLIAVKVTHGDPELAQSIPDALVMNYIDRIHQSNLRNLKNDRDYLNGKLKECTDRLSVIRDRQSKFERKYEGLIYKSPGALNDRILAVQGDLAVLRRHKGLIEQQLAALKETVADPASGATTRPSREREVLKNQLEELERQLRRARINWKKDHPKVKLLEGQLAQLKEDIDRAPEHDDVDPNVMGRMPGRGMNIAVDIALAEAQLKTTSRNIDLQQANLERLDEMESNADPIRQQWTEIAEKREELEREQESWQKKSTDTQQKLEAEAAKQSMHLTTVEYAQKQIQPSSPRLVTLIGLSVIGGLAVGSLLVLGLNALDRSIVTTEDAIEYFNVPVHGVIEEIVIGRQHMMRAARHWLIRPAIILIVIAGLSLSVLNTCLWLGYPDEYEKWKDSPAAYVSGRVGELAQDVVDGAKDAWHSF